jgi:hypothetical protein
MVVDGLRIGLAVVFTVLGLRFLYSPFIAAELVRAGIAPGFQLLLAGSHFVGGLALLVPRLAGEAARALLICVAGSALYLHAEGVGIKAAAPAVLIAVLLLFAAGLELRRRLDASAWSKMLSRYADDQDAPQSANR